MSVSHEIPLPSASDLKIEVKASTRDARKYEQSFEENFRKFAIDSERSYVNLQGLRDHYVHKGRWSWFLMFIMFLMVVFQCFLMWKVGEGVWDFVKYKWLLPLLLVQNLAQVVGLAVFVVKSLFKDIS